MPPSASRARTRSRQHATSTATRLGASPCTVGMCPDAPLSPPLIRTRSERHGGLRSAKQPAASHLWKTHVSIRHLRAAETERTRDASRLNDDGDSAADPNGKRAATWLDATIQESAPVARRIKLLSRESAPVARRIKLLSRESAPSADKHGDFPITKRSSCLVLVHEPNLQNISTRYLYTNKQSMRNLGETTI